MTRSLVCPGCNGAKSKRAQLCATCRRRAISTGVAQVLAPPPEDPRSAGQNSAFHGKCSTLATLTLGPGATPAEIAVNATRRKNQALSYASTLFGRPLISSKMLTRDEMSEILDWLDEQIASESTAL